jgi:hypothetical protein
MLVASNLIPAQSPRPGIDALDVKVMGLSVLPLATSAPLTVNASALPLSNLTIVPGWIVKVTPG